jgi:hypothetical protein
MTDHPAYAKPHPFPAHGADSFYAGALLDILSDGTVAPLCANPDGVFIGMCATSINAKPGDSVNVHVANGESVVLPRSIADARPQDVGKAVWCTSDNIEDASIAYTDGARRIGLLSVPMNMAVLYVDGDPKRAGLIPTQGVQ